MFLVHLRLPLLIVRSKQTDRTHHLDGIFLAVYVADLLETGRRHRLRVVHRVPPLAPDKLLVHSH